MRLWGTKPKETSRECYEADEAKRESIIVIRNAWLRKAETERERLCSQKISTEGGETR